MTIEAPLSDRLPSWLHATVPCLLAAVIAAQAAVFIASTSGTYDESTYLSLGREAYQQHRFAAFAEFGVAPLPVLLCYALPALNWVPDYAQAIILARACAVALVAIPLVLAVYVWMLRESGLIAAALAAALIALSPTVVAHAALATTDACFVLLAILTLAALSNYVVRPTWGARVLLASAFSLAFAAKYTAAFLLGVIALTLLLDDRPTRPYRHRALTVASTTIGLAFVALCVGWALHGFQLTSSDILGVKKDRVPAAVAGFLFQVNHQSTGHSAFLFGSHRALGWWYYQPIALLLKSTYAELVAFGVALAAFVTMRRASASQRVWRLAFVTMLGVALVSRVATGVRYVLLLYPLGVMTAAAWWARALDGRRRGLLLATAAVVILVQTITAWTIAPRYLSYFNAFGGGPLGGYRYLSDSNVDWGQDLPGMRQMLASVGAQRPLVSYFGSAPLEAYGLQVFNWPVAGPEEFRNADWIAISATHLVGLYLDNDPWEAFRAIEPSERPTPAIFVYDAARPDVQRALAVAISRRPH